MVMVSYGGGGRWSLLLMSSSPPAAAAAECGHLVHEGLLQLPEIGTPSSSVLLAARTSKTTIITITMTK
jgi:hypothetical protein